MRERWMDRSAGILLRKVLVWADRQTNMERRFMIGVWEVLKEGSRKGRRREKESVIGTLKITM